jgi:hypothetical protein
MKKQFLCVCALFLMSKVLNFLAAQTVNGIPLKELKAEYIELRAIVNQAGKGQCLAVDYGQGRQSQQTKNTDENDGRIRDDKKNIISAGSVAFHLNLLYENGYEFVLKFPEDASDKNNIFPQQVYHHYLLRKRKQ